MRTTTRRGLAAGAGAAALVVAGAASAAAVSGQPGAAYWEGYFANQGYGGVSCYESAVDGDPGVLAVEIGENWSGALSQGKEWVGVVIEVDEGAQFDVHAWEGYQAYRYGLDAPEGDAASITHAIVCQADEGSGGDAAADEEVELPAQTEAPAAEDEAAEEPTDDAAEEPTDDAAEEPTDEAAEEPADDAAGAGAEETSSEEPTGPAVETDGPSSPGTNLGMVGGAALVLAGAGAAGWAMRRRPAEH